MPKDWDVAEWELKPWSYKLKYSFHRHPQLFLCLPVFGILTPIILAYWKWRIEYPGGRIEKYTRFKKFYIVLRDDDPQCARVIKDENPQPMYTINWV